MDGQYRGPTPSIRPPYIADFDRFSSIISCVFSLVKVIPHETCSAVGFLDKKENIVGSSSPGCFSNFSQFIDFPFSLGGVPVFSLPNFKPKPSIFSASFNDGFAPIRPAEYETSPM